MQRILVTQRPDLAQAASEHGFEYKTGDGMIGWDETAYYRFSLRQIEDGIEKPAMEIDAMCFQLLDRSVADETIYRRLGIPAAYWDYIAASWKIREKDLYGRMDLSYDGEGPAKLLEYNADTPTALYETAVFQWEWLEQSVESGLIPRGCDQLQ